MSKMKSVIDLQEVQTLDDVLRINWMDYVEPTDLGSARPYFVPDECGVGMSSLHYRVVILKRSAMETHLNFKRLEDLSEFPDCALLLTGYKGHLYVKKKEQQFSLPVLEGGLRVS